MTDYRSLHGLSGADTEAQLEREAEDEWRRGCCLSLIHVHNRHSVDMKHLQATSHLSKMTWELVINIGEIHMAHFL